MNEREQRAYACLVLGLLRWLREMAPCYAASEIHLDHAVDTCVPQRTIFKKKKKRKKELQEQPRTWSGMVEDGKVNFLWVFREHGL